MTDAAKEINEWHLTKMLGMIEILASQRVLTTSAKESLLNELTNIEIYIHNLENESKDKVVIPV